MLKRVFAVDALHCARCGGRREVLAMITDGAVVRAILKCLGLPQCAPVVHRGAGAAGTVLKRRGDSGAAGIAPGHGGEVGRLQPVVGGERAERDSQVRVGLGRCSGGVLGRREGAERPVGTSFGEWGLRQGGFETPIPFGDGVGVECRCIAPVSRIDGSCRRPVAFAEPC